MTQAELFAALESLGMPVAYDSFVSTPESPAPAPPFITYQFAFSSDLIADNQNYAEISNFQIELYTAIKDLTCEKLLQDKLKELQLPYNKLETRLNDEKLFQLLYEVQLIGG